MNEKKKYDLSNWLSSLNSSKFNMWREAMAQTRQLHNDVWKGVRFFLTVNGVLIAAIFTMAKLEAKRCLTCILLSILAFIGIVFVIIALKILKKQRRNYTEMLLRKTLIENELGFYNCNVPNSGQSFTFPWKVDRQYVSNLMENPENWLNKHQCRKNTISRLIFQIYYGLIVLYGIIFLLAIFFLLC